MINSGTCFRAPREVLEAWRDHEGLPWAVELDPLYEAAEEVLAVTPLDPETMGRNGQLCMEGARRWARAAGRSAETPVAACSAARARSAAGSTPKGPRTSPTFPVPSPPGRVRAGVQVQRVLTEGGRATGLACRAGMPTTAAQELRRNGRPTAGRDWAVRAKAVISAGGAFGTPELLLRSGSATRRLGRHLHIHPAAWIGARYEEEVRGWEGVMQSYYVDQWQPKGILLEATFTPLSFGAQWLPGWGRRSLTGSPTSTASPRSGSIFTTAPRAESG